MRISTSQIYDSALSGMARNQSQLVKLQNQLSSGRRIMTPADDPIASARALDVTQAKEVTAQFALNQGNASDRLAQVDSQLSILTDLLQSVRTRVIQAGNTVLSDSDREAIAAELDVRLEDMLGLANSRNAEGDYLFSGYQGGTLPFGRSPAAAPATNSPVAYFGDDGERLLQVTSSQQMATSIAGSDLFMNIREGNGTFATAASGNTVSGLVNQGSGVIEAGSVVDQQKWQSAVNGGFPWQGTSNIGLRIEFLSPSSYQLFDVSTPLPPAVPLPPTPVSGVLSYSPGQAIPLTTTVPPTDFGSQVVISGVPASGDTFTIKPSVNKSAFQTMDELISLLRSPLGSGTATTEYSGKLAAHLTNLDQVLANVSRLQTSAGGKLQSLESLTSNAVALDLQYQTTLSDLQDLDYARAITDFTRVQVGLEAAQKSFVSVTGLSLFSYL